MSKISTSNGSLVVEEIIWSGVRRSIKNADGTYENFYRTNEETRFKKTGWGKKAKEQFERSFKKVRSELQE